MIRHRWALVLLCAACGASSTEPDSPSSDGGGGMAGMGGANVGGAGTGAIVTGGSGTGPSPDPLDSYAQIGGVRYSANSPIMLDALLQDPSMRIIELGISVTEPTTHEPLQMWGRLDDDSMKDGQLELRFTPRLGIPAPGEIFIRKGLGPGEVVYQTGVFKMSVHDRKVTGTLEGDLVGTFGGDLVVSCTKPADPSSAGEVGGAGGAPPTGVIDEGFETEACKTLMARYGL